MAQAGRSRGRNGRKKKPGSPRSGAGLIDVRKDVRVVNRIKSGVVEGAEAETCPVCKLPSEGWFLSGHGGKREWYHFGRSFNCVERFDHVAHADDAPAAEAEEG